MWSLSKSTYLVSKTDDCDEEHTEQKNTEHFFISMLYHNFYYLRLILSKLYLIHTLLIPYNNVKIQLKLCAISIDVFHQEEDSTVFEIENTLQCTF